MKLGLGPIPLQGMARHELERLATAAVEASFDSVWVAESRSQGVGGGLAAAALVAQLVPIRVGALVDAGVYHPLHMAEDIAIADLTSQGRLEVLLRGGSDEHLQVLVAALSGAHLRFDGRELRVPARLDVNQPVPATLSLNPRRSPSSRCGRCSELARSLMISASAWRRPGATESRCLPRRAACLACSCAGPAPTPPICFARPASQPVTF